MGAEYWTGEECRGRKKRMDSNNIHLWFNYPPRLDPKDMKPHVPLVPKVKLGHTNRVDIRTAFGQYWSFAHFTGGWKIKFLFTRADPGVTKEIAPRQTSRGGVSYGK